jgi:hypothetical protein
MMSLRLNAIGLTNAERPRGGALANCFGSDRSGELSREPTVTGRFSHKSPDGAMGEFVPMTDYTIAAIPTLYRGRMYRSRLEARWAAFFDRLGWTYEYEPLDLGKWSPDFAITAPFDALVEVKPFTEFDAEVAERMFDASGDPPFLLLTRVAPERLEGGVKIGWNAATGMPVALCWAQRLNSPEFYADLTTVWMTEPPKLISAARGELTEASPFRGCSSYYPDYAMARWADACNAVQWEPAS